MSLKRVIFVCSVTVGVLWVCARLCAVPYTRTGAKATRVKARALLERLQPTATARRRCPSTNDLGERDVDAWKRKFLISCEEGTPFKVVLTSLGFDGELGTWDDIRTEPEDGILEAGSDRALPDASPADAARPPAFTAGDFTLIVRATRNVKRPTSTAGSLSLRPLVSHFQDGLDHPFYGWTDVDFTSLGATVNAYDNPPKSRDPENPGVLVVSLPAQNPLVVDFMKLPVSGGAVLVLIGTVENRKATRSYRDGGGIALKAQAWENGCLIGDWGSVGVVHGAEGRYRLCPKHSRTGEQESGP